MNARLLGYWGNRDEDPNAWIQHIECVFDPKEWLEDLINVSRAKVAQKGLAEHYATAHDHLIPPATFTWEEAKWLFRARFHLAVLKGELSTFKYILIYYADALPPMCLVWIPREGSETPIWSL